MKKSALLLSVLIMNSIFPWGFYVHKIVNQQAIYCLPEELFALYKYNADYIVEHSVYPDKRRYILEGEAEKHFIDLDRYSDTSLIWNFAKWNEIVAENDEDTIVRHGILPWNLFRLKTSLTSAFRDKDVQNILKLSADIGHYVSDAHVPLHTTSNYNGQFTNQSGIHSLWESRVPELFEKTYSYWGIYAKYQENINFIWQAIYDSHSMVDSVLRLEFDITHLIGQKNKYQFDQRFNVTIKTYSKDFANEYHRALNNMVERRLRASIQAVSDFWYTCWVDGGSPIFGEYLNQGHQFTDENSISLEDKIKAIPKEIEEIGCEGFHRH